jgi:hypothetical protein
MNVLPNSVGRIDAITEAIRDGDRERAIELLRAERERLMNKKEAIGKEYAKACRIEHETLDFLLDIKNHEPTWHKARKACGWSGVEGFEGPVEKLPPVKPALKAKDLPIGTVMVLGGIGYELIFNESGELNWRWGKLAMLDLTSCETQELIDRGVEFHLPKGGDA